MIIELPKKFYYQGNDKSCFAKVENGMLKIHGLISLRSLMYTITYQLKGEKQCYYCKSCTKELTMDHMFPQDLGGPTIPNNLLPACQECNNKKSNLTYSEYIKYRKRKGEVNRNKFFISCMKEKEKLKRNKKYQIPEKWIEKKPVSRILLSVDTEITTRGNRYSKIHNFYKKYGFLPKTIVVDKNNFLLDGALILFYAKNEGITNVPVIKLENVEVIL